MVWTKKCRDGRTSGFYHGEIFLLLFTCLLLSVVIQTLTGFFVRNMSALFSEKHFLFGALTQPNITNVLQEEKSLFCHQMTLMLKVISSLNPMRKITVLFYVFQTEHKADSGGQSDWQRTGRRGPLYRLCLKQHMLHMEFIKEPTNSIDSFIAGVGLPIQRYWEFMRLVINITKAVGWSDEYMSDTCGSPGFVHFHFNCFHIQ